MFHTCERAGGSIFSGSHGTYIILSLCHFLLLILVIVTTPFFLCFSFAYSSYYVYATAKLSGLGLVGASLAWRLGTYHPESIGERLVMVSSDRSEAIDPIGDWWTRSVYCNNIEGAMQE